MHKIDEKALAAARIELDRVFNPPLAFATTRRVVAAYLAALPSPESAAQQPATEAVERKLTEIRHQLSINIDIIKRDYPNPTPGLSHVIEVLTGHVYDRLNELESALSQSPSKPAGGSTERPAAEEKRP